MMRSRSLRWIASLATGVLLLAGCDASDNAATDTTLAATTTTAAATTTTVDTDISPETTDGAFDFSTQGLCDWFSAEEIDAIVASTYEAFGVPLDPGDEMLQQPDQNSGCVWASPLVALDHNEEIEPLKPLVPHAALDGSVRVSIQGDGNYGLTDGIQAVLHVDGRPEQLLFGHATFDSLGGDVDLINTLGLTIANEILKDMGWIESP